LNRRTDAQRAGEMKKFTCQTTIRQMPRIEWNRKLGWKK
jgi:hypothetical protein